MNLEVVGCRSGLPAADEPCSCYLVESRTTRILLDAGPGSFTRLPAAIRLDAICITHAHPDHLLDAALLAYARVLDGAAPIRLYTTRHAWELLTDLQPLSRQAFEFVPMADRATHPVGDIELGFFAVPHGAEEAYAIRLDGDGSRMLYSGDCGPNDVLTDAARASDLLLIEASWGVGPSEGTQHMTIDEACATGASAGRVRTVLTHLDPRATPGDVIAATASHGLAVELALPGARFRV